MATRVSTSRTLVLLLTVGCLFAVGCDHSVSETSADPPPVAAKPAPASSYTLTGFAVPEAALYDPIADVYYVSNVGDPFSDAADGFISRLRPDAEGDVSGDPGFLWATGLTSPFGMALDGNTLYVVDRGGLFVYEIDRATGEAGEPGFIALGTEGSLLNDVCVAEGGPDRGAVYVTDTGLDLVAGPTGTDAIYRVDVGSGAVTVLVEDEAEEGPNGCFTNGADVFWTTFKSNKVYRTNPSGRRGLVAALPTGGLDSIVRDGGTLYVSSWNEDPDAGSPTGALYRMSLGGGGVRTVLEGVFTPGDLGFDSRRGRVLVPSVFGNEVVVVY